MTAGLLVPYEVASLEPFVRAGVLGAAEVHTAASFARQVGGCGHEVLLAAALAVRAPLHGHVCVDLAEVRSTVVSSLDSPADVVTVDVDDVPADAAGTPGPDDGLDPVALVDALDWPDPEAWSAALVGCPLVAHVDPGYAGPVPRDGDGHLVPLVVERGRLYLTRFWALERLTAADLVRRADGTGGASAALPGAAALIEQLVRAGGPVDDDQLAASTAGVDRDLVVISGGPGTGKTTTVARYLAGLVAADPAVAVASDDAARSGTALRIALVAPTGKAAARMTEAVRGAVASLADHIGPAVAAHLGDLEASTIHRLLGRSDGGGFRHGPDNPLAHDIVIVDEVSMVSLSLMAHLLAAIRPDATLVLVGDPYQLASVEAGSVLGDLVRGGSAGALRHSVRSLHTVHRQAEGSSILEVADAIRSGRADDALSLLTSGRDDLAWVQLDAAGVAHGAEGRAAFELLERELIASAREVLDAGAAGDVDRALDAVVASKVLCAHRRGDLGVDGWNQRIERGLGVRDAARSGRAVAGGWYAGRPVMVTRNDYLNAVFNGDVGVAMRDGDAFDGDHFDVWFPRAGANQRVPSARLDRIATQWAMTIHKSQGSEFDHVVVVLPDPRSRILTRELLYTAVTRAKRRLTVVSSGESLRAAIDRPVQRASGLADRLG